MSDTDEALMEAYQAGDRDALRELHARYSGLLLRLMQRGMPRSFDADDLVQQTFLQLHRARRDYRPGAPLRPWLITIAMNLKRDALRKLGRSRELLVETLPEPSVDADAFDAASHKQRADALHAALQHLPQNQREVIELHWLEGLSFAEVAFALGASRSAVKVRAHRAYKKLRALLEDVR